MAAGVNVIPDIHADLPRLEVKLSAPGWEAFPALDGNGSIRSLTPPLSLDLGDLPSVHSNWNDTLVRREDSREIAEVE